MDVGIAKSFFVKPSPLGGVTKKRLEPHKDFLFNFIFSMCQLKQLLLLGSLTLRQLATMNIMKYPQLVSMPSAVSDWLEEQLEARGIDSEVYTRYILSLLHAHTLDVIYPEEDLPFSQLKKDGGRGAAFHKRVRRAGPWWRHADADAEQIKRSAAVECLMSAAEQNCEIESLVDELCEKLKEVNSEPDNSNKTNQDTKSNKEPLKQRKISPKELAEKYYAAFPPLNQKEENSYLTSNINLVAGKWPSPEKSVNNIDLIAAKWTSSGSPKKTKRKPKRQPYETMKSTRASQNRNRFGYKKAHCVRTLTREMADNRANWEFVCNNNNNYKKNVVTGMDSFIPTMAETLPDYFNMDENDFPVQWMKDWMAEAENSNQNSGDYNLRKRAIERPQFIPVYPSSIWSNRESSNDWSKNEHSKKPLDYFAGTEERGEPWSPDEQESAIREEYQRSLEEEECAIKMEYERPFIEDIRVHVGGQWAVNVEERSVQIGGRWSTKMEQPLEHISQDALDFGLVKSNDNKSHDDLLDCDIENEANSLLENINLRDSTPSVFSNFHSVPADIWSDRDAISMPFSENECLFDVQTISLMKINHSKECSAFGEYVRSTAQCNESPLPLSGPYSRPFGRPVKGPTMPAKVVPTPQVPNGEMWESPLVLFRPIQTPPPKTERREEPSRKYQDGATFAIRGSLDKVDFKRTNSGTLFLETEFGESKRYLEYQWQAPRDESPGLQRTLPRSNGDEFKLKFWVSQNDKVRASQTKDQVNLLPFAQSFNQIEETALKVLESMDFEKEPEMSEERTSESVVEGSEKCDQCGGFKSDSCKDIMKFNSTEEQLRSESVVDLAELVWKDANEKCKFCNGKHQWPNFMQKFDIDWDTETLKDIWEGTGMCRPRPQNTKEPQLIELREEIKEDAERLMSDLSNVQQAFSDSSRFIEAQSKSDVAPADRKRRHSYMDNDIEMWSFATRLQEDCLINLSTLPTRRSVTL